MKNLPSLYFNMIYYSSVLIALIKDCVNFVEASMMCRSFAAEP